MELVMPPMLFIPTGSPFLAYVDCMDTILMLTVSISFLQNRTSPFDCVSTKKLVSQRHCHNVNLIQTLVKIRCFLCRTDKVQLVMMGWASVLHSPFLTCCICMIHDACGLRVYRSLKQCLSTNAADAESAAAAAAADLAKECHWHKLADLQRPFWWSTDLRPRMVWTLLNCVEMVLDYHSFCTGIFLWTWKFAVSVSDTPFSLPVKF